MAELKTRPTEQSVEEFLEGVSSPQQRADCQALAQLMGEISGAAPRMWGAAIVGYGERHYRYASGRSGDWFVLGFSPRKQNLTLYISGYLEEYADLIARLGKHTAGKGCLYIKRLADLDQGVLRALLTESVARAAKDDQEARHG